MVARCVAVWHPMRRKTKAKRVLPILNERQLALTARVGSGVGATGGTGGYSV